jgi:peptidoglycan hydrolase-like protein with peptidoglycan-binding domain
MPKITTPAPRKHRAARCAGRTGALLATATVGLLASAPAALASPPPAPSYLLLLGSHGRAVARVQHALHMRANGRYSPATRRAVIAFQRRRRLEVDGIVGPQTWDALFHITPVAAPVSTTPTATPATPATSGYAGTGSGYSIPSSIVMCESGGNYSAVNPSSGAGGAYQILPSTWAAYGGQGLPQDASPAEQNQIAAEIYASQGPSAWTC